MRMCSPAALDLKNTTDDALPNYLNSLRFRQLHTQTDVRLGLGYSAVAIAGALFYYDWKFGWAASKPYTLPAVIAYFLLNGAFSYWLWFVERGVVYEGEGKTGKVRLCLPPPPLLQGCADPLRATNRYELPPPPKSTSPSTSATSPSLRPPTPRTRSRSCTSAPR